MKERRVIAGLVLFATVLFALVPVIRRGAELPTAQHHFVHALMLAGAALSGILFAGRTRGGRRGAVWLVIATLVPALAMLLMWPSKYAYFETHPYGHLTEHLALVVLGFLAGFGGERYAAGIGWAAGIGIFAMGMLAIGGYGVVHSVPNTIGIAAAPTSRANIGGLPNQTRGAALFAQNCAVCHGTVGVGGEGPSLKNERSRKSLVQAEAWIQNPAPPMPKLYPGTLSLRDVADVAGYVETLR